MVELCVSYDRGQAEEDESGGVMYHSLLGYVIPPPVYYQCTLPLSHSHLHALVGLRRFTSTARH